MRHVPKIDRHSLGDHVIGEDVLGVFESASVLSSVFRLICMRTVRDALVMGHSSEE